MKYYIANTVELARAHAPEGWIPIGRKGAIYSTPDAVMIETPLDLDEATWHWLTYSVHIYDVREVRWVPQ
jgi:hypothetical protein